MNTMLTYLYLALDNLAYFGILILVFLTVTALVMGVLLFTQRRAWLQERLTRLMPHKAASAVGTTKPNGLFEKEQDGIFVRMTRPFHPLVAPRSGESRKRVRLRLVRGGLRTEFAFYNYLAAKIILAIGLPATFAALKIFYKLTPEIFLTCSLLALLGFFIPDLVVWALASSRQERISRGLPDALDLMVVCVEAGYGLDMTFKRVGEEMCTLSPELSEEIALTNMEIRAGRPREESFKEMATRTGVPEVHNLMTMLIQTSRFGTSLAMALRIHADAMRVKRRQLAEERAAKSAVKLVFPLVLFIFPGLLIVLAGPAFIRIYQALIPALSH